MDYCRPKTLDAALAMLGEGCWQPLAGGTDFYPGLGDGPIRAPVLDITALSALRTIEMRPEGWRIGALATWTDLLRADLPAAFDALKAAAREVGSAQIQNRATLAGNLCNASPAADGVPALLILDAAVELTSHGGTRSLPLASFITGNRRTLRRDDELVTAITVPRAAAGGVSRFLKLGARRYLVISITMVAARLARGGGGRLAAAALSVGACSAVAQRLPVAEAALLGQPCEAGLARRLSADHLAGLTPIDDIRATADYRRHATLEALRRCVAACLEASP